MADRKEERRAFDVTPEDDENDAGMDLENPVAGSLDGMEDDPERYPRLEDSPTGFLEVDIDKEDVPEGSLPLNEADEDSLTVGTDPDLVMDQIDDYTDNPDVLDDFADRQKLADDSESLLERLREHTDKSPILSSSDVDANWERADQVGEEAAGGTVATPDQDIVEELGEALGITYGDDEPLSTEDKLIERDENRWELDPESAEDDLDEDDLEDDIEALDGVGLLNDEDLDEMDEDDIRGMVDELDDNILDDDYLDEDDELDEMDDDFLVGGLDDDDEDY